MPQNTHPSKKWFTPESIVALVIGLACLVGACYVVATGRPFIPNDPIPAPQMYTISDVMQDLTIVPPTSPLLAKAPKPIEAFSFLLVDSKTGTPEPSLQKLMHNNFLGWMQPSSGVNAPVLLGTLERDGVYASATIILPSGVTTTVPTGVPFMIGDDTSHVWAVPYTTGDLVVVKFSNFMASALDRSLPN
jgi:hypothetical protein